MVHQYQLNGYNIVLDSCSGSIHAVDEVAYDIIALYQQHEPEEIVRLICGKYAGREDVTEADVRECLDDVAELVREGKLFSPDTFAPLAGTLRKRSKAMSSCPWPCRAKPIMRSASAASAERAEGSLRCPRCKSATTVVPVSTARTGNSNESHKPP